MTPHWASRSVRTALALALALLPCGAAAGDTPKGDAPQVEPGAAQLRDVEVTEQRDFTVVKLRTSGAAKYRAQLIGSPYRLVLDLEGTIYAGRAAPLAVGREPVKQVRGAQYRTDVARVVVEFTRKVGYLIREDAHGLTVMVPTNMEARSAALDAGAASPATPIPPRAVTAPAAGASASDTPATPVPVPSGSATAGRTALLTAPPPRLAAATRVPNGRGPLRLAQAPPPDGSGPRLISLEFKDADVVNLLRILAAESGRNVVIGEDVKGKMSISLRSVPWGVALQTVLDTKGLAPVERDGILRIVTRDQLLKDLDAEAKLAEATLKPEPRGPLREETVRLYYADAEEVANTLQGILGIGAGVERVPSVAGPGPIAEPPFSRLYGPPGEPPPPGGPPVSPIPEVLVKGLTIRAHKPTNSLFLRLWEKDLVRVKKIIRESLDIALPQVKIEARMEVLDRTALHQIGIQWGGATAQPAGSYTVVGRGLDTPGGIPTLEPGGIPVTGFARANPGLTLTEGLPVSAESGLPLGGNLVNLPMSGTPTGGLAFGLVGTRLNINLALQALASQGKTRTLARPEIVTVEHAKAIMSLGEEIPYATVSSAGTQIQFKEAALRLEVTPAVIREADVTRIKMTVMVENNSRSASPITAAGPAIDKRRAETKVLITEGQRLVIGGVTTRAHQETVSKVPLFGDIPLLGWLFKHRETTETGRELVIFITPSVIQPLNRAAATDAPAP
jgi:type IV pilus secretin PilQ/predicted competence protein